MCARPWARMHLTIFIYMGLKVGIRTDKDGNYYFGSAGQGNTYNIPDGVDTTYLGALGEDNSAQYMVQQSANQANLDLATKQNEWNIQQWERENAYNSPSAQLDRYTAAGINPLFASIDGGKAGNLQSANLANQQSASLNTNASNDRFNSIVSGLQTLLASSDEILKTQVQAKQLQQTDRSLDIQEMLARSDSGYKGSLKHGQDIANNNAQRAADDAHNKNQVEIDNIIASTDLTSAQAETVKKALPYIETLKQEEINKIREEIKNIQSSTTGQNYENQVKAFRSKLASMGINPDADGMAALCQLIVSKPEALGQIFNNVTSGIKESVTDVLNNNEAIQGIKDLSDKVAKTVESWKNPQWDFKYWIKKKLGLKGYQDHTTTQGSW